MAGKTIDIHELPLPQLAQVKGQLEEEISHLSSSYSQLMRAHSMFLNCQHIIKNSLRPSAKDREILVPLTSSLYVPGNLASVGSVIVDVGTGYYVEKSTKDAMKFYQEKSDFIKENLEKLQETITNKQNNLRVLLDVMQYKIATNKSSVVASS